MPKPVANTRCPVCQAGILGVTGRCWKCGTWLVFPDSEKVDEPILAELVSMPKQVTGWNFSFVISSLFLIVTLVAICAAIGTTAPGLATTLAIFALVPAIRTLLVVQKKKSLGQNVSTFQKTWMFLGSVVYVISVYSLLAFALAICGILLLLVVCFNELGMMGPGAGANANWANSVIWVAIPFAVLIFGGLLAAIVSWSKQRWQNDILRGN